jgi:hypothetical protein
MDVIKKEPTQKKESISQTINPEIKKIPNQNNIDFEIMNNNTNSKIFLKNIEQNSNLNDESPVKEAHKQMSANSSLKNESALSCNDATEKSNESPCEKSEDGSDLLQSSDYVSEHKTGVAFSKKFNFKDLYEKGLIHDYNQKCHFNVPEQPETQAHAFKHSETSTPQPDGYQNTHTSGNQAPGLGNPLLSYLTQINQKNPNLFQTENMVNEDKTEETCIENNSQNPGAHEDSRSNPPNLHMKENQIRNDFFRMDTDLAKANSSLIDSLGMFGIDVFKLANSCKKLGHMSQTAAEKDEEIKEFFFRQSYAFFKISSMYEEFVKKNKEYSKHLGFENFDPKLSLKQQKIRQNFNFVHNGPENLKWLNLYLNGLQADEDSLPQIKKRFISQLEHSKNKIFKNYNYIGNKAIFQILKLKKHEINELDEDSLQMPSGERIPTKPWKRPSVSKPATIDSPKKSNENLKFLKEEERVEKFEEKYLQDSKNCDSNGWDYSHAAFKYYHCQPLQFSKNMSEFKKIEFEKNSQKSFNPDQIANLNYFEYTLKKRPEIISNESTESGKIVGKRVKSELIESNKKNESEKKENKNPKRNKNKSPKSESEEKSEKIKRNYKSHKRGPRKKNTLKKQNSFEKTRCDYFDKMDYSSIKKGTPEYYKISKNFAKNLEDILKMQEDLHLYQENRTDEEILVDLGLLNNPQNFSVYFNKNEPKVSFKKEYEATGENQEEEKSEESMRETREIGKLIKLMKTHLGLNCSFIEINELLKKNRGINVVKRMIEFKNTRIKRFVQDFRNEDVS